MVLYYVFGILIFLLIALLVVYFLKRKYYQEIDRLEDWKVSIRNRPVADELSKVKKLNMTGETERLFERWRRQWDEVVTVDLPDVEEYFIIAEQSIDRYRFDKSKAAQEKIAEMLSEAEVKIDKIIEELDELIGSEEQNREEINLLISRYREVRKTLLAHGHTYGKALQNIELELDKVVIMFEQFEEKTAEGNYLEAREVVLQIDGLISEISEKMELIPQLVIECTKTIPAQVKELSDGYKEMVDGGYILTHIQMERELGRINKELETYLKYIEKTEIAEVAKGIEDIKESVDLLFDLLEKEIYAKHFIVKNNNLTGEQLEKVKEANEKLAEETKIVQQSYHLSKEDMLTFEQLSKKLTELYRRFELLSAKITENEIAQTELEKQLLDVKEELEAISSEQEKLFENLQALREDEMKAREKVIEMNKQIKDMIRLIERSNLPGVPEQYTYILQEVQASVHNVTTSLAEKPLNIRVINKNLEIALNDVEKLTYETEELIADVRYAEMVIQYGNRYRTKYKEVDQKLIEAEALFRNYQYEQSLECAATALEQVEPGVLKRIEELINEQND